MLPVRHCALALCLSRSVVACAGDDLAAGPDGASGQAGVAGGAGLSGSSGQGGSPVGGTTGGAGGGAAGGGAGGVSGGGQGGTAAGGQGGLSGTSGHGGASAGEGGQAGAPACSPTVPCPSPSDPCAKAVCNAQGLCEVVPSNAEPPQTEGDCRQRSCNGATSVFSSKLDDAPDPNGQCDVVTCVDQAPVYTPDSTRCPSGFTCQVSSCVCLGCPNGELSGKPGQCRLGPKDSAFATDDVVDAGPVNLVIDGNLGTTWTSTFSPQYGVGQATLTVLLDQPTWMVSLVIHPQFKPSGLYEGDQSLRLQGSAQGPDSTTTVPFTVMVPAGKENEPVEIKLPQPTLVKRISLDVTAYNAPAALHEIAFRACP